MNLRSLKVFALVMEEGTLARAAGSMNLSQSAASRLLHLLEEEFDVRLFRRDTRRLIPTAEAERFYPEALRILSQIDGLPQFIKQIQSSAPEPFRIIAQTRIVNGLVIPAIARLREAFVDQPVKLEIYPRRDLGRRMMNDRYDVGITALPLPIDQPLPIRLGTAPLKVAIAKDHPLSQRTVLRPEDVADVPYIALDATTVIRQIADRELAATGTTLDVAHEVSVGSAAYRFVQRGLGFTFADPIALDPELEAEVSLVDWEPHMEIDIGYFIPDSTSKGDLGRAFVEALRKIYTERCLGK
ncbi:LysR family transcriptional regulator [Roseobacter sp.]|uniref:LysR family transcriptional regulator n=1 Tax=Roseobacter sp. TaxID=1907202 RepID=UPI0029668ED0|nr:LysR family transcriptional regulator [Roseobacter sp.]MDW3182720.1 LysR family transcriptional regulator [Roseobacter sp.]